MKGITKEYLLYLVNDYIKITINYKRNTTRNYFAKENIEISEEEIMDFIVSIPYFTVELKDFMMGNLTVQTIIISDDWEKEFTRKAVAWATNPQWTEVDMSFLSDSYRNIKITDYLSLPY